MQGLKLRATAGVDYNIIDRERHVTDVTFGDGLCRVVAGGMMDLAAWDSALISGQHLLQAVMMVVAEVTVAMTTAPTVKKNEDTLDFRYDV